MLDWAGPAEATPLKFKNLGGPGRGALDRLTISSRFGWRSDPITGVERRHDGIDLPVRIGSPVRATGPGVVRIAGWVRGYGNLVEIEHSGGVRTRYGHLSRLHVFASERVDAGQVIGEAGSTGHSTGPHLHYEVRMNGSAVNPLTFMLQSPQSYDTVWAQEPRPAPKWIDWSSRKPTATLPESQLR